MADKPAVIVAIDFGNTYTGVAWAPRGLDNQIVVKSCWPKGDPKYQNLHFPKVPSTLSLYANQDNQWGYLVDPCNKEVLRGLKALLDSEHPTTYGPSLESKQLLCKYGRRLINEVTSYLDYAVATCTPDWEERFNYVEPELKAVFTVPAAWSEGTCNKLLDAVAKLGFTDENVLLVSEPAAAVATVLRDVKEHGIEKGDMVTVCDAGGATVDLISYRVDELKPLKLIAVTTPDSRICGSTMLDTRFEDHVRKTVTPKAWQSFPDEKIKSAIRSYWQNQVKPKYTGDYQHDFPDSEYFHLAKNDTGDHKLYLAPRDGSERILGIRFAARTALVLRNEHIESIFEPAISGIEKLIIKQMDHLATSGLSSKASYSALILVGGLGSSKYLLRELDKRFPNLKLIQPPDAWTAVVRGALYHAFEAHPKELITAPHNYGLKTTVEFDAEADGNKETAYYDELIERWYIDHAKRVIIDKGEKILENVPRRADFSRDVALNHDLVFRMPLISCDCDLLREDGGAAEDDCLDDRCTANGAQYDDGFIISILEADFSTAPSEHFHIITNSKGQEYCHFHFDFVVTPKADTLLFELQIEGVSYGRVEVGY
ncbi:hypothetical protein BJX65DRAFT_306290 [Aspergillus insuetus]